jgi:hypothetical protein
MQRFNLFVVFYPILWLAFAAMAATVTICGVRWLRFGLSGQGPMPAVAPPPVDPWSAPDQDMAEIVRRAA